MSRLGAALVCAACALVLAGACSGEPAEPDPAAPWTTTPVAEPDLEGIEGTLDELFDLEGAELWLGSEDRPGQVVLGALAAEALEAAGAQVVDHSGLGSSVLVRESLLSGELDLAWERMGRAWTGYLREPDLPDEVPELHRLLAVRDLEENGVVWLAPTRFSDGRAIATSTTLSELSGIRTLGELGEELRDGLVPDLCVTSEFVTFPDDGRVALEEALGVEIPDEALRVFDPEPIYPAVGDGNCVFGQVALSSGRIPYYDLIPLEDDVGAFTPNHPAMTVREDVMDEHPELAGVFALLVDALSEEELRAMVEQVEMEGADPRRVANAWLRDAGLVGGS